MARPLKSGLDYFPLDVDIFQDIKVRKIAKTYGSDSYSILIGLLCQIYRDKGYYITWDDDLAFCVADTLGINEDTVTQVIKKAVEVGFFDEKMYVRHRILTSEAIQARYIAATQKRKEVVLNDIYLVSSVNNPVNDSRNTQSKVKETKVNKSKVKDTKTSGCLTASVEVDNTNYVVSEVLLETMNTLLNDSDYADSMIVNKKIANKDALIRYLKLFFVKLQSEGAANISLRNAKRHFTNWLRIQMEPKNKPKHNFANYANSTTYCQF